MKVILQRMEKNLAVYIKQLMNILLGANYVIKNGLEVTYMYKGSLTVGYVKFFGNSIVNGRAQFALLDYREVI